ncbi:MAG: YIP1 family protein [Nanoarchaeota archaeon]|nr:YIP1 family protein [Nanoarchaeota archaeon]
MFLNKEESFRALKEETTLKDAFLTHLILFIPLALIYGTMMLVTLFLTNVNANLIVTSISYFFIGMIFVYLLLLLIAGLFHLIFKLFGAKEDYLSTLKGIFAFNVGFIINYILSMIILTLFSMIFFMVPFLMGFVMIVSIVGILGWCVFISSKIFAVIHEIEIWKTIVSQIIGFIIAFIIEIIIFAIVIFFFASQIPGYF